MCAGMGTVFSFLIVLIVAINFSSKVIRIVELTIEASKPQPQQPAEDTDEMSRIAAAIAVGRTLLNAK